MTKVTGIERAKVRVELHLTKVAAAKAGLFAARENLKSVRFKEKEKAIAAKAKIKAKSVAAKAAAAKAKSKSRKK
ncbi:MAG: hypothetical protein DRQ89_12430 [Epsilonproteobacteria bacterium]|nr:MAG: hypothetical protein DRQ89_12430 [Campylobacterota bacterium]